MCHNNYAMAKTLTLSAPAFDFEPGLFDTDFDLRMSKIDAFLTSPASIRVPDHLAIVRYSPSAVRLPGEGFASFCHRVETWLKSNVGFADHDEDGAW